MSDLGVIERIDRLLAWHHCQDYTPLDQVDELEIIKVDVIALRAEVERLRKRNKFLVDETRNNGWNVTNT